MLEMNNLKLRMITQECEELVSDTVHTQEGYSQENVLEFCILCRI